MNHPCYERAAWRTTGAVHGLPRFAELVEPRAAAALMAVLSGAQSYREITARTGSPSTSTTHAGMSELVERGLVQLPTTRKDWIRPLCRIVEDWGSATN